MKFGYMSGFRGDLLSEIEFAKKHFDFTEITIQPKLLETIDNIFHDLKKAVNGFEVLGHIHWEITNFDEIIKNIEALKNLGAKKITMHPFKNLDIEKNAEIFNGINDSLTKNQMELLIENVSSAPYNTAAAISGLLEKIPGANITLDMGHANKIFELDKFIETFGAKIKHIHLHDNTGNFDHAFYKEQDKFNKIFSQIKSLGYNGTILLETFSIIQNDENVSQEFPELKTLHLKQLKNTTLWTK